MPHRTSLHSDGFLIICNRWMQPCVKVCCVLVWEASEYTPPPKFESSSTRIWVLVSCIIESCLVPSRQSCFLIRVGMFPSLPSKILRVYTFNHDAYQRIITMAAFQLLFHNDKDIHLTMVSAKTCEHFLWIATCYRNKYKNWTKQIRSIFPGIAACQRAYKNYVCYGPLLILAERNKYKRWPFCWKQLRWEVIIVQYYHSTRTSLTIISFYGWYATWRHCAWRATRIYMYISFSLQISENQATCMCPLNSGGTQSRWPWRGHRWWRRQSTRRECILLHGRPHITVPMYPCLGPGCSVARACTHAWSYGTCHPRA
jgi:hypothetical protein